ncbi:DUF1972 domain-containing protein [Parabacteroides goldsteinii]|jgi:glycosyltransferase involved in cell wall biosynthesis|uniref:DUF1972 domain-containing protein n=1 Tax=Parabacteroides goldsteinii TaxID=328812 RepID=UPI002493BB4D|nr:DUF1972 domain-containing protein [Parabacteroides goldsteinii]
MKVAIIGTVGVPANYGGFETLVEQLVCHNHSEDLQYAIYCSKKSYSEERWVYHGAKIEYVGLKANGIQSIPYDIVSLIRASRNSDVVVVLGISGCAFLPIFRLFSKKRLVINIDGLEHRRDKWGKWTRKFLKFSEKMAVKFGDVIVTDNKGITNYVMKEYGKNSELIAYGGDHVLMNVSSVDCENILSQYGLHSNNYSLAICRIEPENNVHTILEAYSQTLNKKLLFIGNWSKSAYGIKMQEKYSKFPNIKIQPAIYDLKILNVLRSKCEYYLHGHSAGGTNPSLVEAMFFKKPIIAFDCIYNRESTENKAIYFSSAESLSSLLLTKDFDIQENASAMFEIANRRYRWNIIAEQYENLYTP